MLQGRPQEVQNVEEVRKTFGPNLVPKAPEICFAYGGGEFFVFTPCLYTQCNKSIFLRSLCWGTWDPSLAAPRPPPPGAPPPPPPPQDPKGLGGELVSGSEPKDPHGGVHALVFKHPMILGPGQRL